MRWQKLLTKKQRAHLREFQNTLTLREFKANREAQARFQKEREQAGLFGPVCHECNMIEHRLKQAGKL